MPTAADEFRKKYGLSGASSQLPSLAPLTPPSPSVNSADEFRKKYGLSGAGAGGRVSAKQLESSDGLYNLAVQNGLQDRADALLAQQQGEETKKFFSGGYISDIFDVFNAAQYGITGLLKGKSFNEGVLTRQSFSDKDSLGDLGVPGIIAGVAMDIAVDPLTYIAPWTVLRKIPGAIKLIEAGQKAAFGKMVTKTIDTGIEGVEKTYETLEGGTKLGQYLGQKFVWMFGQDSVYRKTFERSTLNTAVETQNIVELTRAVTKLEPDTAAKLLQKVQPEGFETFRFARTPIADLQKILSQEEYEPVAKLWNKIDDMGQEMVDLKLLSKETYEESIGGYIKNAYLEYEQMQKKGFLGKIGVKGVKERVAGLTGEYAEELGRIDNPAYLLFKTAFDMRKDIENVKLFNSVAEKFATTIAQKGFQQLPVKTARLFTTSTGEKIEMYNKIKELNETLQPLFGELKNTFKADNKVLSEILGLEKQMGELSHLRSEEFTKFFQEGNVISKVVPGYKSIKGAERLPENLQLLGKQAEKFATMKELKNSKAGLELEKLYVNGDLERSGFPTMEKFFDYIKNPFNKTETTVKEVEAIGNLKKLIQLQKDLEKFARKTTGLRELDKRSINDSFRYLESSINKINMEKEGIYEQIGKVQLGELAGKYVPQNIYDALQDVIKPYEEPFGKQLIAHFKFFKVIMNPGTHARNIVSNTLLNWWKLGLGPWRLDRYKEAMEEVIQGGKWIEEAKTVGYGLDTFAAAEMKGLLNSPETMQWGKNLGKVWPTVKQKLGDLYQGEENIAKMAAFIHQRKAGVSIEEAWKAAESATFNYAQVTPFVRKLRESLFGFPFITFTIKSAPIVLETAIKAPHRIGAIGKIKQGIENLSDIHTTDEERAAEPSWVKEGFYVKLPMTDKYGRSAYFDLTYILPFGDLISGNFFEREISRETGIKESFPVSLGKKSPFIALVAELGKNKDFYGNKIWKESDSIEMQTKDLMRHLTKTMAPPLIADELPGGYNSKGVQQQKGLRGAVGASAENQKRTVMEELLRSVGAKVQPLDADIQEGFQEFNKKKQMQALLLENGVLNNMNINYVPKK